MCIEYDDKLNFETHVFSIFEKESFITLHYSYVPYSQSSVKPSYKLKSWKDYSTVRKDSKSLFAKVLVKK